MRSRYRRFEESAPRTFILSSENLVIMMRRALGLCFLRQAQQNADGEIRGKLDMAGELQP